MIPPSPRVFAFFFHQARRAGLLGPLETEDWSTGSGHLSLVVLPVRVVHPRTRP